MNRFGAAVLAVAGVLIGGLGLTVAMRLRSDVAALKAEHGRDQAALAHLKSKLDGLEMMLNRMEVRPGGRPSGSLEIETASKGESESRAPATKPSASAQSGTTEAVEDFAELRKKVMDGTATDEEEERFWKLAREKPALLDDLIKKLEKAAADDPRSIEAHRRLSDAYLAKLMSVPDGMEKGIWSNKMIGEEKKILEIDPGDWDARFSVATNYSFWPEQFNKRPDAIKEFETLKRIQETRPTDPKYAETYFQLRQLYLKEGRVDDAKAVLEEGLRLYPNNAELVKARDGVK